MTLNSPQRGNGLADTPEEELLLIHVALVAAGVVLGSASAIWLMGATWLVEHQILVAQSADPLLEIPGTNGAGLDLPRVAVAAGVIVAILTIAVSAARRAFARREDLA